MTTHSLDKVAGLQPHPLELVKVDVVQLTFVTNKRPTLETYIDGRNVELSIRQDQIDTKDDWLQVFVRAAYGIPGIDCEPEEAPPTDCSLIVELAGTFRKHKDLPRETLELFQNNGALITLTPYLREHVYSLSARAGIQPIIIPILQVPIFKLTESGRLQK